MLKEKEMPDLRLHGAPRSAHLAFLAPVAGWNRKILQDGDA
jgi:hypothetical protein